MGLRDRVAIVTGAAGSIGSGIATGLAAEGARVFLTDIAAGPLAACEERIRADGGTCGHLAGDVTRAEDVRRVVQAAAGFGGRIDILVNVAGTVAQGKIEEIPEEEWDSVFAVNCKGTFLMIRETVPFMKAQRSGKIVNFSSKSGKTGSALMCHYSAAKAAIIGLTQALAHELAEFGVTVNCLCPGITERTGVWGKVSEGYVKNLGKSVAEVERMFSAKVPLGRLASIDDIVGLTVFLASSRSDYMTGQAINITGGREMH